MAWTTGMSRSRRRDYALAMVGMLALLVVGMRGSAVAETAGRVEHVQLDGEGTSTKVTIALSRPLEYDVQVLNGDAAGKSARRLVLDFKDATLAPGAAKPLAVSNDVIHQVRTGQFNAKTARIVLELVSDVPHRVDVSASPPQVTIAFGGGTNAGAAPPSTAEAPKPVAAVAAPVEAVAAPIAAPPPASTPPVAAAATEGTKQPPRNIPIRARGRRPYTLNYWR